jgi:hypothetical protein
MAPWTSRFIPHLSVVGVFRQRKDKGKKDAAQPFGIVMDCLAFLPTLFFSLLAPRLFVNETTCPAIMTTVEELPSLL